MDINRIVYQLIETPNLSTSSDSTNSSEMQELDSSSSGSITSSSSDEEHADLLFFPLLHYLTTGRRRHSITNYLLIIDSWTNEEFKEHLRLNRHTAQKLIGMNMFDLYICLIYTMLNTIHIIVTIMRAL